ncbi:hypothetical protein ANCDUO_05950 [Ancylostoma duodenale]|uniref:Uncharacterized protein n=1 Tax=Ancylostoma duodenale TaxID=51022 RepID=A0A0C2H2S4_9BILA|nr:hypothetical protein ANCDUO_05950 [Ancylostoma duodenale]
MQYCEIIIPDFGKTKSILEQNVCSFEGKSLDALKRALVKGREERNDCEHSQKFPEEIRQQGCPPLVWSSSTPSQPNAIRLSGTKCLSCSPEGVNLLETNPLLLIPCVRLNTTLKIRGQIQMAA